MLSAICKKNHSNRSALIDCLRGVIVVSMVFYHGMFDLVYMFDAEVPWFHGIAGILWQQITCCIFVILSGFCTAFGKHTLKRGCIVAGWGAVVSLVTLFCMPEQKILFGVLTLIGSCMILVGAAKPVLEKIPAAAGMIVNAVCFLFTRNINAGTLGFFSNVWIEVPEGFYRNDLTAYLGFPHAAFRSTDYFSLLPWMFLFLSGFFLFHIAGKKILSIQWQGITPFNWIGRQALLIYVLHQPILYGVLMLWNQVF